MINSASAPAATRWKEQIIFFTSSVVYSILQLTPPHAGFSEDRSRIPYLCVVYELLQVAFGFGSITSSNTVTCHALSFFFPLLSNTPLPRMEISGAPRIGGPLTGRNVTQSLVSKLRTCCAVYGRLYSHEYPEA